MNEEKRSKEQLRSRHRGRIARDVVRRERELEGATTFADETKSAVVTQEKQISDESDTIEERNQAAKDAEEHLAQLTSDYRVSVSFIASCRQTHYANKSARRTATQRPPRRKQSKPR
jgi:hypothetical protein